jgi:peptidyl-prolyl cis-trans isomerase SurA
LEWKDVAPYASMKKELQGRVNKDERSKKTQDSFVAKLKTNYGYKYAGDKSLKWFVKNLDSTYYVGKWNAENLKSNKTLFKLNGNPFTQKSFADYLVKNYRGIKRDESKTVVKAQYKAWEKAEVLNYEEQLLPVKYPDFKALVNEYHDGIILYEIMSDKVWNKAVKDTTGLKDFFNKNRANYMWPKRLDATVYECLNKDVANKVTLMLKNDTINSKDVLDVVNKDSELNLKVRMNKFDIEQTNFLKDKTFNKGVNPTFEFEGKLYVVKVAAVLDPMPKEFNEAKGITTSDYQTYLEKTWLDELKAKYPIKINNEVLYNLGNK